MNGFRSPHSNASLVRNEGVAGSNPGTATTYNSGETVRVASWSSGTGLNVAVTLGPNDGPASVQGLLGNDNGNPANDLALPDGTILPQPHSSSTLYGEYANAWRVTQATSLFDYAPGESTATFTDLNFPQDAIALSEFPASVVAQATALVEQAGISDPGLEQSAIYDYLVTGNPTFITEDETLQQEGVTTASGEGFELTSIINCVEKTFCMFGFYRYPHRYPQKLRLKREPNHRRNHVHR